jgi:hypothetical protein
MMRTDPAEHQQVEENPDHQVSRMHRAVIPVQHKDQHDPKPQDDVAPPRADRRYGVVPLILHYVPRSPGLYFPSVP